PLQTEALTAQILRVGQASSRARAHSIARRTGCVSCRVDSTTRQLTQPVRQFVHARPRREMSSARVKFLFVVPFFALAVGPLFAHPVPTFSYDRVIQVKLTPTEIEVQYQLNVDEITIFRDVTRIVDDEERAKLRTGNDIRSAFAKA